MRKHLVLGLATTAVLLSACSSDELLDIPQGKEITFENVSADKSTRSTTGEVTTTSLQTKGFKVSGWIIDNVSTATKTTADIKGLYILQDEEVTYSDSKWTYTNTQHWTANKTYFFAAYAPKDAAVTDFLTDDDGTESDNRTLTITTTGSTSDGVISGSLKFNNSTGATSVTMSDGSTTATSPDVDLVYAPAYTTTGAVANSELTHAAVPFTFKHLLSKVKFQFSNKFLNKFTSFSVEDITITNAYTSGSVALDEVTSTNFGIWTLDKDNNGAAKTFSAYFGSLGKIYSTKKGNTTNYPTSRATEAYYLIPANTSTAYTAEFTITEYASETKIDAFSFSASNTTSTAVTLPAVTMKAGYSYIYSVDIDESNIDPTGAHNNITFTVTEVNEFSEVTSATSGATSSTAKTSTSSTSNNETIYY